MNLLRSVRWAVGGALDHRYRAVTQWFIKRKSYHLVRCRFPALPRGWHHRDPAEPLTSGAKSEGRFGKQDFVYLPEEDAYRCPAGECLPYRGQGTILQFTLPAGTDSAS